MNLFVAAILCLLSINAASIKEAHDRRAQVKVGTNAVQICIDLHILRVNEGLVSMATGTEGVYLATNKLSCIQNALNLRC